MYFSSTEEKIFEDFLSILELISNDVLILKILKK